MSEPERLNERGDRGARALRAARNESAPASARKRATVAVGLAVTATASQSAASLVTVTATRAAIVKAMASIGVVVAVGGGAALGGPLVTRPPRVALRPVTAPAGPASATRALIPQIQGAIQFVPLRPLPSTAEVTAPVVPTPAPGAADMPVRGRGAPRVVAAPPPPEVASPLADEVTALGAAKLALESREPAKTLRLVDAFFVSYPHARLKPEAEALRIEALSAAGDKAGARSFLRAFRALNPDSPLLQHLEVVAE